MHRLYFSFPSALKSTRSSGPFLYILKERLYILFFTQSLVFCIMSFSLMRSIFLCIFFSTTIRGSFGLSSFWLLCFFSMLSYKIFLLYYLSNLTDIWFIHITLCVLYSLYKNYTTKKKS